MEKKYYWGVSEDGFHKIAYREYGTPGKPVVVAVHGLTRNGADFHFLAQHLQQSFHIFAVDMIGRGHSDYTAAKHYTFPQYIADLTGLLARINAHDVYWIGTSMGGLLGMIMASFKNTPIRKLILNDVGPMVMNEVIKRLLAYAGVQLKASTREQIIGTAKHIYSNFGAIDDQSWNTIIDDGLSRCEDGSYTLAYDPLIVDQFDNRINKHSFIDQDGNLTLWEYWDKITCPVYVINGLESDLLTKPILEKMGTHGPKFDYYPVEGAGHAPWLVDRPICDKIQEWLSA